MTLEDPAQVESNKKIFYLRIDSLVKNLMASLDKKKTLYEENKENEKSKKR